MCQSNVSSLLDKDKPSRKINRKNRKNKRFNGRKTNNNDDKEERSTGLRTIGRQKELMDQYREKLREINARYAFCTVASRTLHSILM